MLARISFFFKCTEPTATISVLDYYGVEVWAQQRGMRVEGKTDNISRCISKEIGKGESEISLFHPEFQRYNQNNGIEQLLVNTANEVVENFILAEIFQKETETYTAEHIKCAIEVWLVKDQFTRSVTVCLIFKRGDPERVLRRFIFDFVSRYSNLFMHARFQDQKIPNNLKTLDVLTKRPYGVLPLLDDECKFPKVRSIFIFFLLSSFEVIITIQYSYDCDSLSYYPLLSPNWSSTF